MHVPFPRFYKVLGEFPAVEQWRNIWTLAFHRRGTSRPVDSEELSRRFGLP